MTAPDVAACRAALEMTCRTAWEEFPPSARTPPRLWVTVDDAAACMAEREHRLRYALDCLVGAVCFGDDAKKYDTAIAEARAALAAVQEHPDV